MTSRISNITFDAHDPFAQTAWWRDVLADFVPDDEDEPTSEICGLDGPHGQSVLFIRVPESKTVKNRLHLCLESADGTRDTEVDRLLGLGATMIDDRRTPDGKGWAVLGDPEGNEFCVIRSQAERAAD